VDEFFGENEGLILAEIELSSPDETFDHPAWLGGEVTGDLKYYNACLAEHPYSTWEQ
jgi:CYTH domain-containing protein